MKTKLCWPGGNPYCTCAVAIRAGGDVFLIDNCDWPSQTIKMTSCQDSSGILNIKRTEDTKYDVLTPIGTLLTVRYDKRSSGFINVNIRMAPKDLHNVEGLCGRFDGNINTDDFYNRQKQPTNDTDKVYPSIFSEEWRIKSNDVNYLNDKLCNRKAKSWTETNHTLYCVCENCLNGTACSGVQNTVRCSPSQYLDCPRTNSDFTLEYCKNWQFDCSNQPIGRKRRSTVSRKFAFTSSETKRIELKKIKRETKTYSLSDAEKLCSEAIAGHPAVSHVLDATGGYNISQAIKDCTYDVTEGQTDVWVSHYVHALTDTVGMNLDRDPNYRETHKADIETFNRLSCPLNCSGKGECTKEGHCICNTGFNGSDCSVDITVALPIIEVVGNRPCNDDSECERFEIRTFDVVDGYVCKIKEKQVLIDGRKVPMVTKVLSGYFLDIFTAICTFPTERIKRSADLNDKVFAFEYDVSFSNDGNTYSEEVSFIIYDPTCQTTLNQTDGSVIVSLRDETCFIDGACRQTHDTNAEDSCLKCQPNIERFAWTNACTATNETAESKGIPLYAIVLAAVVPALIMVVVAVMICKFCKRNKHFPRSVSPSLGPNKKIFDSRSLKQSSLDASNISLHGLK